MRSTEVEVRQVALENVLRGVDRATRLVEQLLTLARVDPETAVAGYKQVDLLSLAAQVMRELAPQAHAKQIEISLEESTACKVLGDEVQLSLLLRNLLDNAIRYTQVSGRVTVSVLNSDGITLEVRDTGPGIPKAEREHVLQRFYRISGSGEEGSGLGLSIVRRIAQMHGARLALEDNDAGHGLLVSVIWPSTAS